MTKYIQTKIGINQINLAGAGIANYLNNIVKGVLQLCPSTTYSQFGFMNWKDTDLSQFEAVPLTRKSFFKLNKINVLRVLGRKLQTELYAKSKKNIDFFHAFYFRPPAMTSDKFIPVIHDLSHLRFPTFHPPERLRW